MFRKKIGRRRLKTWVKAVIVLLSAIIFICILDNLLGPIIKANMKIYSENFINRQINTIVYDKLNESGVTYDKLITADHKQDNHVTSLRVDSVEVNKLKTQVCTALEENLIEKSKERIHIPLGNLLGSMIFTGVGPNLDIRMTFLPTTSADINSEFDGEGVNQTKHRVYITVKTEALMALPPYSEKVEVTSKILIAETVIAGEVPNVYSTQPTGVTVTAK